MQGVENAKGKLGEEIDSLTASRRLERSLFVGAEGWVGRVECGGQDSGSGGC